MDTKEQGLGRLPSLELQVRCIERRALVTFCYEERVLHFGTELKKQPEPNVNCRLFSKNSIIRTLFIRCVRRMPHHIGMRCGHRQLSEIRWRVRAPSDYHGTGQR
jgi:hypothetical protein